MKKDVENQELNNGDVSVPDTEMQKDSIIQWALRFLKGAIIGVGAIVPGVSGGVLCVVFGFYEKMMHFFANITKGFKKNLLFFLPVGLGFLSGFVLLSKAIGELLKSETLAPVFIWLFIGAISGTVPYLFKESGEGGRQRRHWVVLTVSIVLSFLFMFYMKNVDVANPPAREHISFWTWMFCGVVMSLGAILPGMSPSSILIYTNLYGPMSEEIGNLNVFMLVPFSLGVIGTIALLSKAVHWLLFKFRSGMYHIILGVVIASTVIIIPIPNYTHITPEIVFSGYSISSALTSFVSFAVGLVGTYALGKLENIVKP